MLNKHKLFQKIKISKVIHNNYFKISTKILVTSIAATNIFIQPQKVIAAFFSGNIVSSNGNSGLIWTFQDKELSSIFIITGFDDIVRDETLTISNFRTRDNQPVGDTIGKFWQITDITIGLDNLDTFDNSEEVEVKYAIKHQFNPHPDDPFNEENSEVLSTESDVAATDTIKTDEQSDSKPHGNLHTDSLITKLTVNPKNEPNQREIDGWGFRSETSHPSVSEPSFSIFSWLTFTSLGLISILTSKLNKL
ncbi:MAG: hypothetical protein AB4063_07710 [Crocosphaera sp.]